MGRVFIMAKKGLSCILLVFLFVSIARAQRAEITVTLSEQFFSALLDAMLQGGGVVEFPIAELQENTDKNSEIAAASLKPSETDGFLKIANRESAIAVCNEVIRLQREIDGVKTALHFRQGQITAPLAFSGNYNPPLIGCINFSGVAETKINLEFDQARQTLFGRAEVTSVNLSGTGGIGGNMLARVVQSAIDKKVNPIEILRMDKISFGIPLQNSGNLRMKAVGVRHEVFNGGINVHIAYEFSK